MRADRDCAALADEISVTLATEVADATDVADATEVSDEELPHNSCTAGESGCARSPAWNRERKIGSVGCEWVCADASDRVAGVTARESGKLER